MFRLEYHAPKQDELRTEGPVPAEKSMRRGSRSDHQLRRAVASANTGQWKKFVQRDGTIVRCLIDDEYLELVVIEDKGGNSVDVPPQMVDMDLIAQGLGFRPKVH